MQQYRSTPYPRIAATFSLNRSSEMASTRASNPSFVQQDTATSSNVNSLAGLTWALNTVLPTFTSLQELTHVEESPASPAPQGHSEHATAPVRPKVLQPASTQTLDTDTMQPSCAGLATQPWRPRHPLSLDWEQPQYTWGTEPWLQVIRRQKERVVALALVLNMDVSSQRTPAGEDPYLQYVALRRLQEQSLIVENLVYANAIHLADIEHLVWDLSGPDMILHVGIRSVQQLKNFIQHFRVKDLGDAAELTLSNSLYFGNGPFPMN